MNSNIADCICICNTSLQLHFGWCSVSAIYALRSESGVVSCFLVSLSHMCSALLVAALCVVDSGWADVWCVFCKGCDYTSHLMSVWTMSHMGQECFIIEL